MVECAWQRERGYGWGLPNSCFGRSPSRLAVRSPSHWRPLLESLDPPKRDRTDDRVKGRMEKKVYIYRPASRGTPASVECLEDPETISGDPVLRGFTLDLRKIW